MTALVVRNSCAMGELPHTARAASSDAVSPHAGLEVNSPGSDVLAAIVKCPHVFAEVLSRADFRCLGVLSTLQRRLHLMLVGEEAWQAACVALGFRSQLYVPRFYEPGWKRLFWEQLWPAREKWSSGGGLGADFKIRVGVRFRPGADADEQAGSRELFLPLHQRLRLFRAGKLSREELLLPDVGGARLAELLCAEGGLPPEVIDAVLGAQHLRAQTAEARAQASTGMVVENPRVPLDAGARVGPNVSSGGDGYDPPLGLSDLASPSLSNCYVPSAEAEGPAGNSHVGEVEPRERRGGDPRVLAVHPGRVAVYVPGQGPRNFAYSHVFRAAKTQEAVYKELGHEMSCAMLNGFNACLLCYGQTGSGKTHTMFGPDGALEEAIATTTLPSSAGIVLRTVHEVLKQSRAAQHQQDITLCITCQYLEIYNEHVLDLLGGGDVQIRGPEATLQGASEVPVTSFTAALELLQSGQERKHFAQTAMNDRSSRAHTVFALNLTQVNRRLQATARSTLHLVDLAGCEQLKTSKVSGDRQKETIGINSSLLVLGKVITALIEGRAHVPYFESALTRLLRPALGGNSRTTVVVNCSPEAAHGEQTLSALRFGERCQQVVNRAELESVSSVQEALGAIDSALHSCQEALASQEARDLVRTPAYQRLRAKYTQLMQTRCSLAA